MASITPENGSAITITDSGLSCVNTGLYLLQRLNPLSWEMKATVSDSPTSDGSFVRFFGKKFRRLTGGLLMIVESDEGGVQDTFNQLESQIKSAEVVCEIVDKNSDSYPNCLVTTFEFQRESGPNKRIVKDCGSTSRGYVILEALQLSE